MTADTTGHLEQVAGEVVSVLRSGIDPDAVAMGDWTVRDVAAHLAGLMDTYRGFVRGDIDEIVEDESAAQRIARGNASCVQDRAAVPFDAVVDAVETAVGRLVDELAARDPAETVQAWQARPVTVEVVAGFALSEFCVHGDDIAQATGRRWRIPADAARAACLDAAWALPWMLDPEAAEGVQARWVVRLRGGGARWFQVRDGAAEVDRWHGQPADCTILATPDAMLLVNYGRRSPWREMAKGKLLAWGRRPWIAVQVLNWLPNP